MDGFHGQASRVLVICFIRRSFISFAGFSALRVETVLECGDLDEDRGVAAWFDGDGELADFDFEEVDEFLVDAEAFDLGVVRPLFEVNDE